MIQEREKKLMQLKIDKLIDIESDKLYEEIEQVGNLGALAIEAFQGKDNKTQMNNLKEKSYSSRRLSDIYDFIKKQTGKSEENKKWRCNDFGEKLLKRLYELENEVEKIVNQGIINIDKNGKTRIHLILCREYIKHLVSHFLYGLVTDKKGGTK